MAKTKIEKIADIQGQIAQLENHCKRLMQQHKEEERKARTKRLIVRGAILESLTPGADALTNEQIKIFLEKTIQTDFARKTLFGLTGQGGEAVAPILVGAGQGGAITTAQTMSSDTGRGG